MTNKKRIELEQKLGRKIHEVIAYHRLRNVNEILKDVIVRVSVKFGVSRFDKLIQRTITGLPITLAILLATFTLIFTLNTGFPLNLIFSFLGFEKLAEFIESVSLSSLIDELFTLITNSLRKFLISLGTNTMITSLICDGILAGLSAVLVFIPLIASISLVLAIIEDSGLATRFAITFHSLLSRFGVSGKSLYPMLICLGCNVPAILSTRTAIDVYERKQMICSLPFIPCQARLIPIMAFALAYFKNPIEQALVVTLMYVLGIVITLLSSLVIRRLIFKIYENPELIFELPPIHKPNVKVVSWILIEHLKHFIKKAGIVILCLSVAVWFLLNFGFSGYVTDITKSFGYMVSQVFAPIISTLFNIDFETSWKITFGLLTGFIAKESFLSTLAILYGVSGEEEVEVLKLLQSLNLTIPQVLAILTFFTLVLSSPTACLNLTI